MVTMGLSGAMLMSRWHDEAASCAGCGMGAVRYAVRVRGRHSDAVTAAAEEGLEMAVDPVRTVLRGRLPDQAALLGVLARARMLGLELVEVRRRPRP
jgi:hypothetical protein